MHKIYVWKLCNSMKLKKYFSDTRAVTQLNGKYVANELKRNQS